MDLQQQSVMGIFIKNVLPDSPAGRCRLSSLSSSSPSSTSSPKWSTFSRNPILSFLRRLCNVLETTGLEVWARAIGLLRLTEFVSTLQIMKRPLLPFRLLVNINEKMIRSMGDRMIMIMTMKTSRGLLRRSSSWCRVYITGYVKLETLIITDDYDR